MAGESDTLSEDSQRTIGYMPRHMIKDLLTAVGIACYDDESAAISREARSVNVADGAIDLALAE